MLSKVRAALNLGARSIVSLLCLGIITVLTGCGIGMQDTTSANTPVTATAFSGRVFGGPTPIVGATVTMWATGSSSGTAGSDTGYGVGTQLAEATQQGTAAHQDTDQYGNFSFSGSYNCPTGEFAYLVAAGGNSGSYTTNANSLLVAALGRCEDLYTKVSSTQYNGYKGSAIYINELTTIAAAYALGHFATVSNSGQGSSQQVLIGATATNNAAQVSGVSTGCVSGVGSCTTTAAAGLAHAFKNAANLVNVFTNTGTGTGANATVPGNSSAIVPQALINTIGNILITCVNSVGGTSGACGTLFTATTIGSSVPADTFSAMVNLAANPTLGGNTTAVANLYGLATSTAVYSPNLTASTNLNDFSIAINYPGGASGNTAMTYPQSGALDINDVYYIGSPASSGNSPVTVLAYTSNGTYNGVSGGDSSMKNAFGLSMDGLGHGYFANGSGSSSNSVGVFSTSSGVPATPTTWTTSSNSIAAHPYYTAVDRANNLWAVGSAALSKCTTAGSCTTVATPTYTAPSSNFTGLAIDPDQNIWMTASTALSVLPNASSSGNPTYSTTSNPLITATTTVSPATGITFVAGTSGAYTAYISSYNTASIGIQPYTTTLSGNTITGITAGSVSNPTEGSNPAIAGSYTNQTDGSGVIWIADTNSHSIVQYGPGTTPTAYRVIPCGYITTVSPITCGSGGVVGSTGKPYSIAIDSAGSIWATDPANVSVFEIIGSAAPTWPLLSLGLTGKP